MPVFRNAIMESQCRPLVLKWALVYCVMSVRVIDMSLWHDFPLHVTVLVCAWRAMQHVCLMLHLPLLLVLPMLLPLCYCSLARCHCHAHAAWPPATAKAAPIASAFRNCSSMLLVVGFGIC